MRQFPFPSAISKQIIQSISSSTDKYQNWFRSFITPKEYYYFRSQNVFNISFLDLHSLFSNAFKDSGVSLSYQDFEAIMRYHNKLCLVLLLYRSGLGFGKTEANSYWSSYLILTLFKIRVNCSSYFSLSNCDNLELEDITQSIDIVMPVCPDYSYEKLSANTYRYTFQGVGGGIGLVASKALENAKKLQRLFHDSPLILSRLRFIVLVGDFEAKPANLSALSISKSEFISKVNQSADFISNESGFISLPFSSLINGLDNWHAAEEMVKSYYKLASYESLDVRLPSINHDRNLLSRIPLYTKWYGLEVSSNFKSVFFDQVIEYILMGDVISYYYGSNACVLASDHKAMRKYYNVRNMIPVIGTSNEY